MTEETPYARVCRELSIRPARWLVTGVAGFIGSNLLLRLLELDQTVVGLDNLETGSARNLEQVQSLVGPERWRRFAFIEGSIRDLGSCVRACAGADYVLHQAALGSVPRSLVDPVSCHEANVSGFLHMIQAATEAKAKSFVYASSSAVYGDHPALPKVESQIGAPLSPYAASKYIDEVYADVYQRCYALSSVGLRYFNVFGPRQNPDGAYAAVIPKWIAALIAKQPVVINGDGETSRDFCYVANVVQANILAATRIAKGEASQVFNVACQERTTLNQLFALLRGGLAPQYPHVLPCRPEYREFRAGDVRHSLADVSRAAKVLGYSPTHDLQAGLNEALAWYTEHLS
ncbi:MAG: SDR family oxidoreductase [Verrucomicrobia bacterium]|nr:SDR family oxidoreductase [Verrucomicrobiota bacterium]